MPITQFPITDPDTGEKIDNFKTMPAELIQRLRDDGFSDEEIRCYQTEYHDASVELEVRLRMIFSPEEDLPRA